MDYFYYFHVCIRLEPHWALSCTWKMEFRNESNFSGFFVILCFFIKPSSIPRNDENRSMHRVLMRAFTGKDRLTVCENGSRREKKTASHSNDYCFGEICFRFSSHQLQNEERARYYVDWPLVTTDKTLIWNFIWFEHDSHSPAPIWVMLQLASIKVFVNAHGFH